MGPLTSRVPGGQNEALAGNDAVDPARHNGGWILQVDRHGLADEVKVLGGHGCGCRICCERGACVGGEVGLLCGQSAAILEC